MHTQWKGFLVCALFVVGVLLATLCAGIAVIGDMEALLFDASLTPDAALTTLRCPILITAAETATISAQVTNSTDRTVQFPVYAHISQGYVTWYREERFQLSLAPGERRKLEWTAGPNDAAWDRVIMVRVHALRSGGLPYRAGGCGIMVVPVSFLSGGVILGTLTAAALLCMGGGIALWALGHRPLLRRPLAIVQMMAALAGILVAAILVGFLGLWLPGLLLLILAVLLAGIIIGFLLTWQ